MNVTITSPSGIEQSGTIVPGGYFVVIGDQEYSFEQLLNLGYTIRKANE